jgi:hypothetical protein
MPPKADSHTLILRHWRIRIDVPSEATGNDLCMVSHSLDSGYLAMPLRRILKGSAVLQPIRGVLSIQVGNAVVRASPGESILIPRGAQHTFWNSANETIEFREFSAPGGLDRYYEALAPLIPVGGKADVERVFALSEPYGLEFDVDSLLDLIGQHRVHLV